MAKNNKPMTQMSVYRMESSQQIRALTYLSHFTDNFNKKFHEDWMLILQKKFLYTTSRNLD